MVVYESAKIIHGRQFPLDGDYYKKFQAINDYVWP